MSALHSSLTDRSIPRLVMKRSFSTRQRDGCNVGYTMFVMFVATFVLVVPRVIVSIDGAPRFSMVCANVRESNDANEFVVHRNQRMYAFSYVSPYYNFFTEIIWSNNVTNNRYRTSIENNDIYFIIDKAVQHWNAASNEAFAFSNNTISMRYGYEARKRCREECLDMTTSNVQLDDLVPKFVKRVVPFVMSRSSMSNSLTSRRATRDVRIVFLRSNDWYRTLRSVPVSTPRDIVSGRNTRRDFVDFDGDFYGTCVLFDKSFYANRTIFLNVNGDWNVPSQLESYSDDLSRNVLYHVSHHIGHVLGLGHSSDYNVISSVMYANATSGRTMSSLFDVNMLQLSWRCNQIDRTLHNFVRTLRDITHNSQTLLNEFEI